MHPTPSLVWRSRHFSFLLTVGTGGRGRKGSGIISIKLCWCNYSCAPIRLPKFI